MKYLALSLLLLTGCSDILGPEDLDYEEFCTVYVDGEAFDKDPIPTYHAAATQEQRERCLPPIIMKVYFR